MVELTRAQSARAHQAGRDQAAVLGCITAVGFAIPGVLLPPMVDPLVSQGFVSGALAAATISLYSLAHGSIYRFIEQRRRDSNCSLHR